ncbi:MAG: cupin domain-containing protein [Marinifilum sp.]|jgi:quercetin dioxygenase-like cupin family protein|nr:cupin domain-containing protein [Marinifilum sp.]
MIYPYLQKTEVLNADKANGYLLANTSHADFVELHIQPSGVVPAHALPIDVCFYVVAGSGTIHIEQEETKASTGDIIEVNKNLQRSWINHTDSLLKLLVIKQK